MKIKNLIAAVVVSILMILTCSIATAREVNVALFDFDLNSNEDLNYLKSGISALLPSRISLPKKINVIESYLINKELNKVSEKSLPIKTSIAKKLGADFLVTGSITKIGSNISIDARLIDIVNKEKSTPVFIQSIGVDNMIPEINNFSKKIRRLILDDQETSVSRISDNVDREAVGSKTRDLSAEKIEKEPLINEEPVYEYSKERSARKTRPEPPKPVFEKTPPLLQDTSFLSHKIKHAPLHYLASGDINGDGKQELLVAGITEIFVFQMNGNTLTQIGKIKTKVTTNIIRIDTANMNGNEIDEIYVSSYEGHFPNSLVIEYQKDKYEILLESKEWFFRVMRDNTLLGQRADTSKIFSGPIHMLEWKENEIISREEVLLPSGVSLYGYTENDIDEDINDEYIAFHKGMFSAKAQLVILSYTGRIEWQDIQKMGGSPNTLTEFPFGDETEKLTPIPLRILCDDYNNDDRLELISARNSNSKKGLFKGMVQYNQGEVMCLQWNGSDLETNWTTGTIKGYVTDYIMADIDSDNRKELITLSVSDEGFWGKAKNTITVYQLSE